MPPNPRWDGSGRRVKCAAGVGGDGDRIGGERSALALFKLGAQWKCYSITRTLSLVTLEKLEENVHGKG